MFCKMSSDIDFNVGVVLPAAGCGERMNLPTPKQFCSILGRPLISYTIDCFHRIHWIKCIVVSTNQEYMDTLSEIVNMFHFTKVKVVEGGNSRHHSIHCALKTLHQVCSNVDVVVIHDAVRPFVSRDIIYQVSVSAHLYGAVGVCRPLVSTVIARDEDQRMIESLDRRLYVASEMPQAFQTTVIMAAYEQCTPEDYEHGTECLLLALKYTGVHAKILDGTPDLWKVTYKKDLFAAEAVIKESMLKVQVVDTEGFSELTNSLKVQLNNYQLKIVNGPSGDSICAAPSGDATDVTNGANTFIVIHRHISSAETVDKLSLVQSKLVPAIVFPGLIDFRFVHVLLASKDEDVSAWHTRLAQVFRQSATEWRDKNVLMWGILASEQQTKAEVAKMVVNVLWKADASFSGQIFLI